MKITLNPFRVSSPVAAYTIAELMTSMAIFTLILGGLLAANMFGMQQDELTNSKLGANDSSRVTFNLLLDEIRSSKDIQIGTGYYTNFTPLSNGVAQQGQALQIIPSTNTSLFIYYWFDTNAGALWRCAWSNGMVYSSTNLITQYLTNANNTNLIAAGILPTNVYSMMFRAMDYTGTTNLTVDPTNYNYNYVINILLQFYQYQFPMTAVGSNRVYNYYQLSYSATRRSP